MDVEISVTCLFVNVFQTSKQYTGTFNKENKREKNTINKSIHFNIATVPIHLHVEGENKIEKYLFVPSSPC